MPQISIPRFILPKRIYKQIIFRFLWWVIPINHLTAGIRDCQACWKEIFDNLDCQYFCCCLMASLIELLPRTISLLDLAMHQLLLWVFKKCSDNEARNGKATLMLLTDLNSWRPIFILKSHQHNDVANITVTFWQ